MSKLDCYTFTTCCGRFRVSVKPEFNRHVNVHDYEIYQLLTQHHMTRYLHNPYGPALVDLNTHVGQYFLNGKPLSHEEGLKMSHDNEFNTKLLTQILGDE